MIHLKLCKQRHSGFTLLELMVVIAIISILAGLSAPTFTRQIAKAKLVEAQNLATQHQSLVEEYILLNGKFPDETNFSQIKQTLTTDSIAKSISVSNQNKETGRITITFNNSTGISADQFMRYSRNTNRNWQCASNIDKKILPQQCSYVEE